MPIPEINFKETKTKKIIKTIHIITIGDKEFDLYEVYNVLTEMDGHDVFSNPYIFEYGTDLLRKVLDEADIINVSAKGGAEPGPNYDEALGKIEAIYDEVGEE